MSPPMLKHYIVLLDQLTVLFSIERRDFLEWSAEQVAKASLPIKETGEEAD